MLNFTLFVLQKKNPSYSYEIIVVNDGSTDKTSEVNIAWSIV